jgi:hypothetical protein
MHPFLKNIQLNNSAGEQVNLGEKRKGDAEYDILNLLKFSRRSSTSGEIRTVFPTLHVSNNYVYLRI